MQYNQSATKFSHVYAGQSISPFLYITIKAHATGKKLRLCGKNWPNLLFRRSALPVLTRYHKTIL